MLRSAVAIWCFVMPSNRSGENGPLAPRAGRAFAFADRAAIDVVRPSRNRSSFSAVSMPTAVRIADRGVWPEVAPECFEVVFFTVVSSVPGGHCFHERKVDPVAELLGDDERVLGAGGLFAMGRSRRSRSRSARGAGSALPGVGCAILRFARTPTCMGRAGTLLSHIKFRLLMFLHSSCRMYSSGSSSSRICAMNTGLNDPELHAEVDVNGGQYVVVAAGDQFRQRVGTFENAGNADLRIVLARLARAESTRGSHHQQESAE